MVPSELSIDEILRFMLEKGGKVTNHELVKHFQNFLTHPETRVEARNHFKEYVNTLATISNDNGKKHLVLKRKYRPGGMASPGFAQSPMASPGLSTHSISPSVTPLPTYSSPPYMGSQDSLNSSAPSPSRAPPPYRAPPPPVASPPMPPTFGSRPAPISPELESEFSRSEESSLDTSNEQLPPPVPPRRKSSDKLKLENKENVGDTVKRSKTRPPGDGNDNGADGDSETEQKISVKERMQKFNRLSEQPKAPVANNYRKKQDKGGDDDDSSSVTSVSQLDPKSREWLVLAAKCDYHGLAKLATENPRLARLKDPTSTALHWGAKHGDEHVVRLIAGTYGLKVDAKTNGGYTPLHIAMQYGHEDIYNLLVQGYNADRDVRDFSGRKPRQYQTNQNTSVSADTFRKIKARKKQSEKELGFLRMGSLNVRVKRTTEAFSQFLGVGQSSDKLHKTWGSADNIPHQQAGEGDRRSMPPPKYAPIKKRKSKRAQDFALSHSQSTPNTPPSQPRTHGADSDSDTAAGFGTNWKESA